MEEQNTSVYSLEDIRNQEILLILKDVIISLEKRGYNPVNQLVGYIMSGDSGYISSYNNARNKINSITREKLVEFLIKGKIDEIFRA